MRAKSLFRGVAAVVATALSIAVAASSLGSCGGSIDSTLKLPPTPPLSGGLGWAVVETAYARLKAEPSEAARDLGHLRRGSVVRVVGREMGASAAAKDKGLWCRLKTEDLEGYARESDLDLFGSKEQAERAARKLQ